MGLENQKHDLPSADKAKKKILGEIDSKLVCSECETKTIPALIQNIAKFKYPKSTKPEGETRDRDIQLKHQAYQRALDEVAASARKSKDPEVNNYSKTQIDNWCKIPVYEKSGESIWAGMSPGKTYHNNPGERDAAAITENKIVVDAALDALGLPAKYAHQCNVMAIERTSLSNFLIPSEIKGPEKGSSEIIDVRIKIPEKHGAYVKILFDSKMQSYVQIELMHHQNNMGRYLGPFNEKRVSNTPRPTIKGMIELYELALTKPKRA